MVDERQDIRFRSYDRGLKREILSYADLRSISFSSACCKLIRIGLSSELDPETYGSEISSMCRSAISAELASTRRAFRYDLDDAILRINEAGSLAAAAALSVVAGSAADDDRSLELLLAGKLMALGLPKSEALAKAREDISGSSDDEDLWSER